MERGNARGNVGKESTEQAQILEAVGKKKENMKQEIWKTSQKENLNDTEECEFIEERKTATDVKEQTQMINNYQK